MTYNIIIHIEFICTMYHPGYHGEQCDLKYKAYRPNAHLLDISDALINIIYMYYIIIIIINTVK